MPSEIVRADWVSGRVFLLRDRGGFPLVMTQPQGVNGADLLPLSVIGCAAWDIIAILEKQRQQVTGLQVSAESEQEDEPPWRFKKIRILYRFSGHNLNPAAVQQAIELSEQKYCSTFATLRAAVEIESAFEIVDSI